MRVTRATPAEFFAFENASPERHQYFDGEIVAMAGGRPRHEEVVNTVTGHLALHQQNGGCRWFSSNVRVRAGANYFYPDLCVACDPVFEGDPSYCLTNPRLIVEILSPSTESDDRGRKFAAYRTIPSLREYLLIHTDRPKMELHRRVEEGWLMVEREGEDQSLTLISLGLDLSFREIFALRIASGWAED